MPVDFSCENCHRALRLRDELAGRRVKCPGCSTTITVPAAAPTQPVGSSPELVDEDEASRGISTLEGARPLPRHRADDEERPGRARRVGQEEDEDDGRLRKKEKKPAGSPLPLVLGAGGGLVALLLIGLGVWWWFFSGKGQGGNASDVSTLRQWVPGNSQLVVSLRVADLLQTAQVKRVLDEAKKQNGGADPFPPQLREVEAKLGVKLSDVERVTFVMHEAPAGAPAIRMPGDAPVQQKEAIFWAVVELTSAADEAKVRAALEEAVEIQVEGKKCITGSLPGQAPPNGKPGLLRAAPKAYVHFVNDRFVVISNGAGMRKAISLSANRTSGPQDEALALIAKGKHLVSAGADPDTPESRKGKQALKQLAQGNRAMKDLMPFLEAKSSWGWMHLEEAGLESDSTLVYAGEAEAQAAKKAADEGLKLTKSVLVLLPRPDNQAAAKGIDVAKNFIEGIKVTQQGDKLLLTSKVDLGKETMDALMPLVGEALAATRKVREAAARMQTSNNMKQMLLAMHTYHDVYKTFPGDILHPMTKKPLLSWRVAVLPYIGEDALYKQFKLDEPWNSPHNRRLLTRMPQTYAPPDTRGQVVTHYQVFTGPGTAYPAPGPGLRMAQFKDGTSNTALLAEAQLPVEWTRPADIAVAPGQPITPRLRPNGTSFLFGFADSSVRAVSTRLNDEQLRPALTPNGRELLPAIFDGR